MRIFHKCCCCSLQKGCYIVGVLYVLWQMWEIAVRSIELHYVREDDEREDDENKHQRKMITIRQSLWLTTAIVLLIMGKWIIIAACKECASCLKLSAVVMALMAIIMFLIIIISVGRVITVKLVLWKLIPLLIFLYFSIVLWSYAQEINEEGTEDDDEPRVYVAPSGNNVSGQNYPATQYYYPPTGYNPYQEQYDPYQTQQYPQYPYYPSNYPQSNPSQFHRPNNWY